MDFSTGRFYGYVWSANLGWINLGAGDRLSTDSISRPDTDGDGIGDVWEYAFAGDLTTLDCNSDPDGDGQTNAAEYLAATSPFAADQVLHPVLISITNPPGFVEMTLKWFGNGARNYTIEASASMAPGSWNPQNT